MASLEVVEVDERLLLESEEPISENGGDGPYTGDGSVDIKGNPILKHHTGNWKACFFILGTEFCERLAYFGIEKNLVTFLTTKLHEGNVSAARNVTTWEGTCNLAPLVGAVLADSYWGRYWTIAAFVVVYLIGMVTLTLTASVSALTPPACVGFVCSEAISAHVLSFLGLYLIALGSGGIRPCVSLFGADQFDDTNPLEKVKKGSFFNWFSFSGSFGSLISATCVVWIQDSYGWGLGFGICALSMGLAIGSFFLGSVFYRFQQPRGSPLTRVCQVIVASLRKWNIDIPHDGSLFYELPGETSAIKGSRKLEHTAEFKFFDKAATISNTDDKCKSFHNPWRLCTITQVEELKIVLRMLPILAAGIIFYAANAQVSSMFLEQGMFLDKCIGSFNIPPASLSTFVVISVLMWIPIYDIILEPSARRFTGKERGFSHLQRIGIGLFMSIPSMVAAALVEGKRLEIAKADGLEHQEVPVPMSILWQIPQYFLIGAAEVFTIIGHVEFFYDQSPDAMRSLCTALYLVTVSLGNYLSSLVLSILTSITTHGGKPGWIPDNLNEGHLDYFFWFIAGLSFLNLLVFVCCAMRYQYKQAF